MFVMAGALLARWPTCNCEKPMQALNRQEFLASWLPGYHTKVKRFAVALYLRLSRRLPSVATLPLCLSGDCNCAKAGTRPPLRSTPVASI